MTRNAGEDVEREGPLYNAGGNVDWYNHYGNQCGDSSKIKNRTTICASTCITLLFTIAGKWNQPRNQSTDE